MSLFVTLSVSQFPLSSCLFSIIGNRSGGWLDGTDHRYLWYGRLSRLRFYLRQDTQIQVGTVLRYLLASSRSLFIILIIYSYKV